MKSNTIIIISIVGRLLAFIAVLAFVFGMICLTHNLKCLYLLFLLLAVPLIPVYETKRKIIPDDTEIENKEEE